MSDNSWYEKGDPPPVGSKLVYRGDGYGGRNADIQWKTIKVLSVFCLDKKTAIAFDAGAYGIGAAIYNKAWFEPVKTDRETAIDEMARDLNIKFNVHDQRVNCEMAVTLDLEKDILGKLYDAGYRKNES